MRSLLSNESKRSSIIDEGKKYIRQFEPNVIAKNLTAVYRDLIPQPMSVGE
jgi:hypothetical protein